MNRGIIDQSRQTIARRYASFQRCLTLAEVALGILFLAILLWSGGLARLRQAIALPLPAAAAMFFTLVVAAYSLFSFPLSYYQGFALPRRYGLTREPFRSWLVTVAKEALLGWLLGILATVIIYLLLFALPEWWWLGATALMAILSAVLSFLAPWFILPLFFKAEPLPQGELRQRLESLAVKAGFHAQGIFTIDWGRKRDTANAMFLGMGRSRRIVLTDTLFTQYAPEEVETILAHELGHYRHGHVWRLLLFQAGLALVVFFVTHLVLRVTAAPGGPLGLQGLADLAGLPMLALALLVFSLALAPVLLAYSRYLENQADVFCLKLTGNPQAFAQSLARLGNQNLIEAEPSRWVEALFHDHPPLARRLARAQWFRDNKWA